VINSPPAEPLVFRHAAHPPGTTALQLNAITVRYGDRAALENVSLSVEAGERIAIVGPNGAGKTTLFKAIAGLMTPVSGDVRVFGQPPRRHACIAYLVQRSTVDWRFPVTVRDAVMMGRTREIGLFRRPRAEDRARVDRCIEQVGMTLLANRPIGELSGGQQQRMFIARALAQEAALMLLDEPFTGLDHQTERELLALLGTLAQRGVAILVATHDLDVAATHFDRVVLLNRCVVACDAPSKVFTAERLSATFGPHARAVRVADGIVFVSDSCCGGGAP
jgi:ABC-type Mn2+/Zn2+ transport system ATPase subunit